MKILKYVLIFLPWSIASCQNNPAPEDQDPTDTTVVAVVKNLENGIVLPNQWPPYRSYSSDLLNGMAPFYLYDKPDTISISVGRQLFVDDFLIETSSLTRVHHYPEYYSGNPVLFPDKDWEKSGTAGGAYAAPFSDGVWYDEKDGKFKVWYYAGGGSYSINNSAITCYAESTDGMTWSKPSLNVVTGTNIVDYNCERDASVVWIDKQEQNMSKRYKMFLVVIKDGKCRYHYKTSIDGKMWREAAVSKPIGDRSTVYKNPFRNTWVFSVRHNVRVNPSTLVRSRDYSENSDPVNGTLNAEALLSSFWFGSWPNEQHHPRYPNVQPGIYNQDATPYESIMLGLFSVWQGPENDVCAANNEVKRNQIMLGYSRDGYNWLRQDMNPFLPVNETAGAWNFGNVQSVVGSPLIVGDKLYFYCSGRRMYGTEEIGTMGLATLRRDGFVSMKTTTQGELTTPILKFSGDFFFVNLNVTGKLLVELLDEKGNVIPGFSKNDCLPASGDYVKTSIKWANQANLQTLKGRKIKIKFYMENGELYSFWIAPTIDGKSQGYTGGGGPNLNISGIDK